MKVEFIMVEIYQTKFVIVNDAGDLDFPVIHSVVEPLANPGRERLKRLSDAKIGYPHIPRIRGREV